jgi:ribosomal protein L11 methyltransferase
MQQLDLRDRDMLDLGTGSGVLAIAAIKLGARRATGIDRDPDALASARTSVAVNHVASRVALRDGDVSTLALEPVAVVAANLTGAALIDLAPVIIRLAEAEGHLVLGGILAEEEHAVTQAYRARTHPVWRAVEDDWVGLVLRNGTR